MRRIAGTQQRNPKRADALVFYAQACGVFLTFLALYLNTRQSNFSTYHDAIAHLKDVLSKDRGPHPHHLLFRWVERGWLSATGALDQSPGAAAASAASLSALGAAAVVALAFLLLRRGFGLSGVAAFVGATLVGVSYGPWLHGTVINVYIMPLSLLMMCLLLLSSDGISTFAYATVGVLHAFAVLIHQAYGLFVFVVMAASCMDVGDRATRMRRLLVYGTVFCCLVGVPYLLVGTIIYKATGPGDFIYWLTTYAHGGYWSPPGLRSALKAILGSARSCFGLLFVFATGPAREFFSGALGGSVVDEQYAVRNLSPITAGALLLVTCIAAALMLATIVVRARTVPRIWVKHRRPFVLTLTMLGAFTLFFLFWMPQLLEFWIPQLTAFWMLWAAIAFYPDGDGRWPLRAGMIICGCLLLANFVGGMRYLQSADDDYYYACAKVTSALATEGDIVAVENENLRDYLSVFYAIRPLYLNPDAEPVASVNSAGVRSDERLEPIRAAFERRANVIVAGNGPSVPAIILRPGWRVRPIVDSPCRVWKLTQAG